MLHVPDALMSSYVTVVPFLGFTTTLTSMSADLPFAETAVPGSSESGSLWRAWSPSGLIWS